MNAEQIVSLAEITKDAINDAYEHEDKSSAATLAKSLAALVNAVAAQIIDGEIFEIAEQFKVA